MRLSKRERQHRKAMRRIKAGLQARQAAETKGMVPIIHNSFVSRKGYEAMPVGAVNPGGNVFRPATKADKPVYAVEREPRLGSKPSASLKRQTVKKRFGTL